MAEFASLIWRSWDLCWDITLSHCCCVLLSDDTWGTLEKCYLLSMTLWQPLYVYQVVTVPLLAFIILPNNQFPWKPAFTTVHTRNLHCIFFFPLTAATLMFFLQTHQNYQLTKSLRIIFLGLGPGLCQTLIQALETFEGVFLLFS